DAAAHRVRSILHRLVVLLDIKIIVMTLFSKRPIRIPSSSAVPTSSEKEVRMALDGIVLMVNAFFRNWDDTEKMWSEYERAGFRLVVIGGELHLSELRPVERMKYRCKHRRLVERWRDMRLEGSKLDGLALGALHEGRKLGLFEDMVQGSDLG